MSSDPNHLWQRILQPRVDRARPLGGRRSVESLRAARTSIQFATSFAPVTSRSVGSAHQTAAPDRLAQL